MRDWRARLLDLAPMSPVVMITVVATQGSTPREVGARMLVHASGIEGSIGGGQLEFQECAAAEALLARTDHGAWHREVHRVVLGPDAGQCCGGVVEVLHEVITAHEVSALARMDADAALARPMAAGVPPQSVANVGALHVEDRDGVAWLIERLVPSATSLHLYGAGHVARALVHVLQGLPFALTWIDIERARFPAVPHADVDVVVTAMPVDRALRAPADSLHLVMTHSHDLDFDLCKALLTRVDTAFVGLIGSATKRARFVQRLQREGLDETALARLVCPIGLSDVPGKAPEAIAVAVAAQLLTLQPSLSWKKS